MVSSSLIPGAPIGSELDRLEVAGHSLAYRRRSGQSPTLMFLPGYASDMDGAKAEAIDGFAAARGLAFLRLDYSGTGLSLGSFADATLDRWLGEALAMLDQRTDGPVILVGSSMGGWIALHLALQRPQRIAALVGLAAAPDFTDWGFSEEQHAELRQGRAVSSDPRAVTLAFLESGQALRLLAGTINITCPVRLVHGELDADVPVSVAQALLRQLGSTDAQLTILKGSGHRLSEPREIDAIVRALAGLVDTLGEVQSQAGAPR